MSSKDSGKVRALFLAGHPALDFLNTRMNMHEDLVDLFQSDEDVFSWLKHAGFRSSTTHNNPEQLNLLDLARMLRENIRALIEGMKGGRRVDPSILNKLLLGGCSYPQLVWGKSNELKIKKVRREENAASILAPIAEAAADLLTTGNFDLVKRCEGQTCVLWFSDQTKSHRRRWCSMELCGNRHKVAAYRARRRDQSVSS
jgi:predicted RNA-binding Zn ribbon-like protein